MASNGKKSNTITIKSNFNCNYINLEEEMEKLNLKNIPFPKAEISYEPIPQSSIVSTKSISSLFTNFVTLEKQKELTETHNNEFNDNDKNKNALSNDREENRKLFIGSINLNTTGEELKNKFIKYGEIERISITYDFKNNINENENTEQGYAYIVFRNKNIIEKVLASGDNIFNNQKPNSNSVDNQLTFSNNDQINAVCDKVHQIIHEQESEIINNTKNYNETIRNVESNNDTLDNNQIINTNDLKPNRKLKKKKNKINNIDIRDIQTRDKTVQYNDLTIHNVNNETYSSLLKSIGSKTVNLSDLPDITITLEPITTPLTSNNSLSKLSSLLKPKLTPESNILNKESNEIFIVSSQSDRCQSLLSNNDVALPHLTVSAMEDTQMLMANDTSVNSDNDTNTTRKKKFRKRNKK